MANLSIRVKFASALALIFCFFACAVTLAWRDVRVIEGRVGGLYAGPMQTVDLGRAVQRDFMDLRRHYLSAALVPSSKWAQHYALLHDKVRQDLDGMAQRLDGPDARDRFQSASRALADWDVALARGNFSADRVQIDRLADGFQTDIDQIIEGAERDARSRVDEVSARIQASRLTILFGGAVAILLGMVVMIALAGTIVRPLEQAARIAGSIAAGHFLDVIPQQRSDEPGQLLRALFMMRREIQAQQHELARRNFELERIASTDKLTGLNNRRKLEDFATEHLAGIRRYGGRLSAILLDIDHFKAVNDIHGHPVGDSVIMLVAAIIGESVREADVAGRWGGEEFLVLLPNTTLDGALVLAEKIRRAVAGHDFPAVGSKTVSLGVSQLLDDETMTGLVARADQALYRAKQMGRNRVEADHAIVKDPIAPLVGQALT
jgi:diguanylate cyclase (GGDEF)-like protein